MKGYPLEALRQVRDHAVEERQQQLAVAAAAHAAAVGVLREAQELLRAEQARLTAEQEQELRRVEVGVARASDLQRLADFRAPCEGRIVAKKERVDEAEKAARLACEACAAAEQQLGAATADAKLIARHQDQFLALQHEQDEAQIEELAVEAWSAAREKGRN